MDMHVYSTLAKKIHNTRKLCYLFLCLGVSEVGTASARFYHMLSAASATGEYEKVCHGEHRNFQQCMVYRMTSLTSVILLYMYVGLFENYLNIRFKDPNFEAVSPMFVCLLDVLHVLTCIHYVCLVTGVCWFGLGGVP